MTDDSMSWSNVTISAEAYSRLVIGRTWVGGDAFRWWLSRRAIKRGANGRYYELRDSRWHRVKE